MLAEFLTCNAITVKIKPSSSLYKRVVLKIDDDFNENEISTELSKWDCKILISILERALQWIIEE